MRRWMSGCVALAGLAALLGFSGLYAQAADLPGGFFYDQPTCFERIYTKEHMRKHPLQRVTRLRFEHFPYKWGPTGDDQRVNPRLSPKQVHFRVVVSLRGQAGLLDNSGTCYQEDGRLNCYIECDGGSFELVRDGLNRMLVRNQGFSAIGCDASSQSEGLWVNAKPDDKVFRVYRLPPGHCRAPLGK